MRIVGRHNRQGALSTVLLVQGSGLLEQSVGSGRSPGAWSTSIMSQLMAGNTLTSFSYGMPRKADGKRAERDR